MRHLFGSVPSILALTLLIGCSNNIDHLANAQASLEESNYPAAIVELKNALQKNPKQSEARWLLGKAYFEIGEIDAAHKELSRALEGGVSEAVMAPVLAQVLLIRGEYDTLQALSEQGLSPQDLSTVTAAKAASIMAQGDTASARKLLSDALEAQPPSPYAHFTAAQFAVAEKLVPQVREHIDKALTLEPNYVPALSLLADLEIHEGRLDEAEAALTKAIDESVNDFENRLKRARLRIRKGNLNDAQKDISALRKFNPRHPGVSVAQGLIFWQKDQADRAREFFEKAVRNGDNYPSAYYYLAAVQRRQGSLQQANQHIKLYRSLMPESGKGLKLEANIAFDMNNYEAAEELLEPFVAFNPEDQEALNLLANTYLARNKNDEAVEILGAIAKQQPDSAEAQTRLGAGLLAQGKEQQGIETLRNAIALDPGYLQPDLALINHYLRKEDFDAALTAATDLRDRNPDEVLPYSLMGRIHIANGAMEEAKTALAKAEKLAPADTMTNHLLAEIALREEDAEKAYAYYNRVLEAQPHDVQTLIRLAAAQGLAGQRTDMVSSLRRAIAADPAAMQPKMLLARYFAAQGQSAELQELFSEMSESQRSQPQVLSLIAASQVSDNKHNQAIATLQKLINDQPDVQRYHYLKAMAHLGLGESSDAVTELERVVELSPNHFFAKVAMARLSLIRNELPLFEKQLADLKEQAPDQPDVMQLEAASALIKGDNARATELLERIYTESPATNSLLSLALQKRATGDLQGAIKLAESWLEEREDDTRVRQALATFYVQNDQEDKAIEQYRKVIKLEPRNLIALNNQTWLLREKDPGQALKLAEKAATLAPESSVVLDTLAVVLLKNDEVRRARETINKALRLDPGTPTLLYHKAQITLAEGDEAGAKAAITSLLSSDREFDEREDAEALLQQLR